MVNGQPLPDDGIRVGTAERERIADLLNEAFEQGRLDLNEHGERLSACFSAVTRGDLRALVADLPGSEDVEFDAHMGPAQPLTGSTVNDSSSNAAAVARRTPPEKSNAQMLRNIWTPWAGVSALVTMIWLLTVVAGGEGSYFWPIWVMGPWGAVNLVATLGIWSQHHEE